MKTLVLAIGNSGRQDDGLGWAFGEALERTVSSEGEVHYRYQLQVEDADLVTTADRVVFVDAFKDPLPDGFQWKKIAPNADFEFTTHALSPEAVLFFLRAIVWQGSRRLLHAHQRRGLGVGDWADGAGEEEFGVGIDVLGSSFTPHPSFLTQSTIIACLSNSCCFITFGNSRYSYCWLRSCGM
ncbi:MAG: hypothetical protein IPN76_23285 [Saprospiraceae bacterium]|nr:hypothetical protein [Saprospiraceae bacterium]